MKQNKKILIADDEKDILEFLTHNFEKEGFDVVTAKNGLEAINVAKNENPDLIILDVMMPGLDGIEACKALREIPQFKSTIVVFLTARSEDYSEIAGFDAGANDYISKPIRSRTLTARVKSLLKRNSIQKETDLNINFDNLKIDTEKRIVIVENKEVSLPKKEFELLRLLSSAPRKVFTREEILMKIWGNDSMIGDRTIDVHVRKLREKIGNSFIKTSKGVGYSFNNI